MLDLEHSDAEFPLQLGALGMEEFKIRWEIEKSCRDCIKEMLLATPGAAVHTCSPLLRLFVIKRTRANPGAEGQLYENTVVGANSDDVITHSESLVIEPRGTASGSRTAGEPTNIQDHFLGLTWRKLSDYGKHWAPQTRTILPCSNTNNLPNT